MNADRVSYCHPAYFHTVIAGNPDRLKLNQAAGVEPSRLVFAPRINPKSDHLRRVDISSY